MTPYARRTQDTSAALRAAGRRLFARRGYDGASVRAITSEAGTNLGAVTYHYGSKKALYEAVLEDVLGPLPEGVGAAAAGGGTALERMEAVVRFVFDHLDRNPDMPQLMLQEIAAGKAPPPPVQRILGSVIGTLVGIVEAGQAEGSIRAGVPVLLALSVVAQPVHLTLLRRWARELARVDQDDPAVLRRVVDHAVAFVHAGLTTASPAVEGAR